MGIDLSKKRRGWRGAKKSFFMASKMGVCAGAGGFRAHFYRFVFGNAKRGDINGSTLFFLLFYNSISRGSFEELVWFLAPKFEFYGCGRLG